jgi:hypothetical protein
LVLVLLLGSASLLLVSPPSDVRAQPTIPSGVVTYVPITLTNNQASATVPGFQQMLTVDWSTYSAYLNSGVQNVEFFDGSGTLLKGWCQSSCSNAAVSSTVWVNLGSDTIAANGGSLTIYLGMLATTNENMGSSSTSTWGEAPQLSGVYGGYDDGLNVFSFYDNFAGTQLNSKWTIFDSTAGTLTVNNGIQMVSTNCCHEVGIFASFTASSTGNILETYEQAVNPKVGFRAFFAYGTTASMFQEDNGYGQVPAAVSNTKIAVQRANGPNLATAADAFAVGGFYNTMLVWQGNDLTATDLTTGKSASATDSTISLSQVTQVTLADGADVGNEYTTYWYFVSVAPPGATMPLASFGTVTSAVSVPPLPGTAGGIFMPVGTTFMDSYGHAWVAPGGTIDGGTFQSYFFAGPATLIPPPMLEGWGGVYGTYEGQQGWIVSFF